MLITKTSIPRVSPKAQEYVKRVLEYGFHNCSSPGMLARLEREFAAKFGQKYGIAHANGTATMHSALLAYDVGVGDEVIVPAYTVFSTGVVALHANAIPIIADVDPDTWTISVEDVRRKITPRTKAIIPVSICGLSPDMDPILDLARQHNLLVIEDNAQCVLGILQGPRRGLDGPLCQFQLPGVKTSDLRRRRHPDLQRRGTGHAGPKGGRARLFHADGEAGPNGGPGRTPLPADVPAAHLGGLELPPAGDRRGRGPGRVGTGRGVGRNAAGLRATVSPRSWPIAIGSCRRRRPTTTSTAAGSTPSASRGTTSTGRRFGGSSSNSAATAFMGHICRCIASRSFANLSRQVQARPERYPHFAGRLPDYREVSCPVWEKIQPRVIQLKTNYFDLDDARRQAEVLAQTIDFFRASSSAAMSHDGKPRSWHKRTISSRERVQ